MSEIEELTDEDDFEPLEEEEDDDDYCTSCAGTGEGMYDGAHCSACNGRGVKRTDDCEAAIDRAEYERDMER